jgi:hypothetical protein
MFLVLAGNLEAGWQLSNFETHHEIYCHKTEHLLVIDLLHHCELYLGDAVQHTRVAADKHDQSCGG